jgi:predicted transcriptional regulator
MLLRKKEDSVLDKVYFVEIIRSVPIKQRIVLALKIAGYSQLESGKILGITRAAISGTLKRATIRLQKTLKDFENENRIS